MSFKDSGIEWLSHIPSDWEVKKLKYLAEIIDGDRGSEYPNDKDLVDNGILFLSGDNLKSNGFNYSKVRFISEEKFAKLGRGKVLKNDIITSVRGTIGSAGLFSGEVYEQAFINAQMMIIRPRKILDSKFLFYFTKTKAWKLCLDYFAYGTAQQQLSNKILMQLPIAVPGLKIQHQVIKYLDNKINTVDKIIEQKEQLTSMLEQQRQSIITEAVTKGLNPNVKMKDSGVEWIGEIPEHWNTSLLKLYLDKLTDGSHFSPEMMDVGYPYITVKDLKYGNIDLENALKISEEDYNVLVKNGCQPNFNDVLLSKDGTIGKVAVVKENEFVILSSLAILRPNNYLDSSYLSFWLESLINKNQMESFLAGAALRRLTLQTIKKLRCIIPPLNEQLEIVKSLKERLIPLDESILLVSKQIKKLKEYRQSLIYEAVTGKIDVRDMEVD
ncbi:restriction endonuclease subunit S [Kurthia huakuii]|uniref:restriction endonuclease subunit S n=1 Tax=Kurthia huakuii TaxID=1421019 RepID=UPI000496EB59|nr:restriction endonuclease subunit S [Kurthia huakuii]MBM7699658.1 type I restriction enzyme S subunit [Kurthia huakuii]